MPLFVFLSPADLQEFNGGPVVHNEGDRDARRGTVWGDQNLVARHLNFTEAAKTELYRRFCEALRPGGILFLGATESIPNVRAVGLQPCGNTFYRRP